MQVTLYHPEDLTQLQQQSRQERDAKQRDRYRAILLALEGQEAPAIARTLGRSRGFVQGWVYRYRDHGLEAVVPKRQSGRPPKFPVTKEESFKERFLAGWHLSKDLQVPENLTLLHLPPYSPELDPVERLWAFLERHYLSNRVYEDDHRLFQSSGHAWNQLTPEQLCSICRAQWTPHKNSP